jgi:hypothetical protein
LSNPLVKGLALAWGYTDREMGFPLTTSLVKGKTLAWDSNELGRGFPPMTLWMWKNDFS